MLTSLLLGCADPASTPAPPGAPAPGADPAAVGRVLGVDEPEDPELAAILASSPWAPRTYTEVFVGDAAGGDPASSPMVWAEAQICAPIGTTCLTLDQVPPESGWFTESPPVVGGDLYEDLAEWSFQVDPEGLHEVPQAEVGFTLPAAVVVAVPDTVVLGAPLALEFANQGFSAAFAVVLDDSGAETWSSEPLDVETLLAEETASAPSEVVVPTDAFPSAGTFAVGLAGTIANQPGDVSLLDPMVSSMRAGRLVFFRVEASSTPPR